MNDRQQQPIGLGTALRPGEPVVLLAFTRPISAGGGSVRWLSGWTCVSFPTALLGRPPLRQQRSALASTAIALPRLQRGQTVTWVCPTPAWIARDTRSSQSAIDVCLQWPVDSVGLARPQ